MQTLRDWFFWQGKRITNFVSHAASALRTILNILVNHDNIVHVCRLGKATGVILNTRIHTKSTAGHATAYRVFQVRLYTEQIIYRYAIKTIPSP